MNEVKAMLQRQSAWQRDRAGLTWTEKVRLAATLRKAAVALRASGKRPGKETERQANPLT